MNGWTMVSMVQNAAVMNARILRGWGISDAVISFETKEMNMK